MKKRIYNSKFQLYLWTGLAFAALGTITSYAEKEREFSKLLFNNCWAAAYLTVVNYLFFDYAWRLFRWRKPLRSLTRFLPFLFLYSAGAYLWRSAGIALDIYTSFKTFDSTGDAVADRMSYSMESLFFFGIIRHVYNYVRLKQSSQQLLIEKQQAELNYLKSQTNPHFLFNTLNNIYSLARDKNDLAPESIMRLSKILRYMLYETTGAYIAIEQELKIIGDYMELEKLRYDKSLSASFSYDVEDLRQALPPLLLMPLVENAFKHGVSETRIHPHINVHLQIKKRNLLFVVTNSCDKAANDVEIKESIGLKNLRRQLELLFTTYRLSLRRQEADFTATLEINLGSHV